MTTFSNKSTNNLAEEDPSFPNNTPRQDTQESMDYYEEDGYGDYDDFTAVGMKSGGGGGGSGNSGNNARQQKKNHQRDNTGNRGPYSAKHTRLLTARQEKQRQNGSTTHNKTGK